ncbi:MAG: PH domain-containing protein, partial [Clostridia bacterium]|nr:PH domain-containing protein [Clostridia bacterium]
SKIPLFWRWVFGILFCWLLLIPLIKAIQYNINFATTEFAVTNKEVVEKYGWASVHCDEMRLEKIENITINQSFMGRIFNYGNVHIQGANRNNINFTNVKDVNEIKKAINNLL